MRAFVAVKREIIGQPFVTIGEVMTSPVTTLSPSDSHGDAVRLMQQKNIRRIPLVEAERVVGIVTPDDLLLDEGASLEQLAMVIESQIGLGGPLATLRWGSWRSAFFCQ